MSKQDEREFFNKEISTRSRRQVGRYYAVMRYSRRAYADLLRRSAAGGRVLEYGCGSGSLAFDLSPVSRNVVGIDISDLAIGKARAQASERGLTNCHFLLMDAERMGFADDSFDLICGTGILHHLDLPRTLDEIARVLSPGGRAVFLEPLGHNPLLNLFRRLTPSLRTRDEHPLRRSDLDLMRCRFRRVGLHFWHLLAWLSLPFLPSRHYFRILSALDAADERLFRLTPALGPWAWYVLISLEGPCGRRDR